MITPDGFFDWAERLPGPPVKQWPDVNARQGVVFHSAVGSIQGVINVVFLPYNPDDDSTKRSVTGVIGYDGRFVQFYPVTASPWGNGSHEANKRFPSFEHEGGKIGNESEPLTEPQIAVDVRILQDLNADAAYWERPISPVDRIATLYEHREMIRFGADPTACPSGRIPWTEIKKRLEPVPPEDDNKRQLRGIQLLMHMLAAGDYHPYQSDDGFSLDFYRDGAMVSLPITSFPFWWDGKKPNA